MNRLVVLVCLLAALAITCAVTRPQSQAENASIPERNEVVLTKLSDPVYPRLAMQARVIGDVELNLFIRRDGTVDSAEYVRGPAMLVQAAIVSAKNSKFDCSNCMEATTSYRLVYSFQAGPPLVCANRGVNDELVHLPGYPQVTHTNNRVILVDQLGGEPCSGDVILTPIKVRSVRCLYLWKCSLRYPL
jgi:hypothetical protein